MYYLNLITISEVEPVANGCRRYRKGNLEKKEDCGSKFVQTGISPFNSYKRCAAYDFVTSHVPLSTWSYSSFHFHMKSIAIVVSVDSLLALLSALL